MKVLEFIKHKSPYVKGDIAGIEDALAVKLIAAKIAVEYKAPIEKSDSTPGNGNEEADEKATETSDKTNEEVDEKAKDAKADKKKGK